ncbi:hypothetical protein QYE76_050942 [Lolium multiflorum]|uniref:CCHC-type domain-containing protein n=1 Tax=Lolium multiflorum TaxID=4521 RepID=A0AAD8WJP4_LOLMU|nr:hypothetical protein QYE76_050942 [Lolium multiflorum]
MIQQAVSEDDRPYIEKATTAKDAWDILAEVFLGSSSMRQNKFQEVSNKAEGFYMEDGEHHRDMYRRLKALAISFRDLGATYVDDDWIKRKYINALLPFEPADLRILKNKHNFEQMTSNDVMQEMDAFKVESKIAVDSRARAIGMKRSENLALKAHVCVEDEEELRETKYEGHSEELKRDLHGHIALLTKSFWRDPSKYKLKGNQRGDAKGPRVRTCYNCGNQDHFIAECPYENREDHGGKLILKDKSKAPRKKPFVKKSGYDICKKPSKCVLIAREEYSSGEEEDDYKDDSRSEVSGSCTAVSVSKIRCGGRRIRRSGSGGVDDTAADCGRLLDEYMVSRFGGDDPVRLMTASMKRLRQQPDDEDREGSGRPSPRGCSGAVVVEVGERDLGSSGGWSQRRE